MSTNLYRNKIYRKLNEDIHVVMVRGTQMVNYKKNSSSFLLY